MIDWMPYPHAVPTAPENCPRWDIGIHHETTRGLGQAYSSSHRCRAFCDRPAAVADELMAVTAVFLTSPCLLHLASAHAC